MSLSSKGPFPVQEADRQTAFNERMKGNMVLEEANSLVTAIPGSGFQAASVPIRE